MRNDTLEKVFTILAIWLFMVTACFVGCKFAHAAETEWTTENVYRAIATESIGEGKEGMEYVASCFWNRMHNHLNMGSSGLLRRDMDKWLAQQPEPLLSYAHHLADRVIYGVDRFDTVNGATQFESIDFPLPKWVTSNLYTAVFHYKKHIFYAKRVK